MKNILIAVVAIIAMSAGSVYAAGCNANANVNACQVRQRVNVNQCQVVQPQRVVVREERVVRQVVDPVVVIAAEEEVLLRRFPDVTITREFRGPLGGGVKRSAGPNQRSLEINGPLGVPLIRRTTIVN